MQRDIRRAYRVLGLLPGASPDQVKSAYHELAQVWHPDRFGHSDKLKQKAERNFQRINQAYQLLKDYRPTEPIEESVLSATMSAVLDMGDILQTRDLRKPAQDDSTPATGRGAAPSGAPQPRRTRSPVVGLEEWERTGVLKKPGAKRSSIPLWAMVGLIAVAVALVVWLLGILPL